MCKETKDEKMKAMELKAKTDDQLFSAARRGDVDSMFELCERFLYGKDGHVKDREVALNYCRHAARKGHKSAQRILDQYNAHED